jgi:predicted ribosome-associated RNA-binding protein Tma20
MSEIFRWSNKEKRFQEKRQRRYDRSLINKEKGCLVKKREEVSLVKLAGRENLFYLTFDNKKYVYLIGNKYMNVADNTDVISRYRLFHQLKSIIQVSKTVGKSDKIIATRDTVKERLFFVN